jgi:hypothetical protein
MLGGAFCIRLRALIIVHLFGATVVNLFRSRRRLEVENLFLRHQLNHAMILPHRANPRGYDFRERQGCSWIFGGH